MPMGEHPGPLQVVVGGRWCTVQQLQAGSSGATCPGGLPSGAHGAALPQHAVLICCDALPQPVTHPCCHRTSGAVAGLGTSASKKL